MRLINEGKRYTGEEDLYIEERWGNVSIKAIARNLGRSETAIESRAYRLGLGGSTYTTDKLSTGECAKLIGVHITTINYWINNLGLKAKLKKTNAKAVYRIDIDDFIDFLEEHQHLWNAMNVEEHALGFEYDWLVEKRKRDNNEMTFKNNSSWTTSEERKAIEYFRQGLSTTEISTLMHRTALSLRKKRADFIRRGVEGIESSPIWTDFQKAFTTKNWGKMSVEDISDIIEKPVHLVERFGWENKLGDRFKVQEGYYTFIEIAKMLNLSRSTPLTWHKKYGLKATEQNKGNKKRLVVALNDLELFLKSNQDYSKYLNLLKEAI